MYLQPIGPLSQKRRELLARAAALLTRFYGYPVRVREVWDESTFPTRARRTHPEWGMPQLRDIRQPAINSLILDAVLVPLVGFDDSGHRLGMGAGFYDRHFARLRGSRQWRRPRLIGVAYAAQQVSQLPAQAHDIRLDRIVTERAVIVAKAR